MKKLLAIALTLVLLIPIATLTGCDGNNGYDYDAIEYVETPYAGTTLHVYNWGENIANGEDGSVDLVKVFEKRYNINVDYTTYASNEEMYTKLKAGTVNYDVIIPSDYMIARLINEDDGYLQKIDYSLLKNYQNIAYRYRVGQYFDCAGEGGTAEYSVPYTVGMVGVIYNTKYVSEEDVAAQSWDLLWNANYKDKILTFNNSRDGFGVAQFRKGLDVNASVRTDAGKAMWDEAYNDLLAQRSVVKGYVMDEIFNAMEGENAYVGTYYAGDCLTMIDENDALAFYYPKEGTNFFVDSMCIPKCAKNVGAAHLFIDFLLETEFAIENSLYICYASPNETVYNDKGYKDEMGEDYYAILYDFPEAYLNPDGTINTAVAQSYGDLDDETKAYMSDLWDKVK